MARGMSGAVCSHHRLRELSHTVRTAFEACRPQLFSPTLQESRTPKLRMSEQLPLVGLIVSRRPPRWSCPWCRLTMERFWLATQHRGVFYLQDGRISRVSNGRADTNFEAEQLFIRISPAVRNARNAAVLEVENPSMLCGKPKSFHRQSAPWTGPARWATRDDQTN